MLFTEKYRPKSLSQMIGQREAIRKLILDFIKKRSRKALLIHGPAGCGKTSAVYAMAADFGLDLIELNASDFRDKESMESIVRQAVQQKSLFSKDKVILIDELDGIDGNEDRGGISELGDILLSQKLPIIMIANNPYHPKLKSLLKKVDLVKFDKLDNSEIIKLLQLINEKESLNVPHSDLKKIALLAEGDARAALNDLQVFFSGTNGLEKRDKEVSIYSALQQIFKSNTLSVLNALDNVEIDYDEAMLWIDENLPLEYSGDDLARAYYMLSKADIFKSRIIRRQHWRFLAYVNIFLTAGIALSKDKLNEKYVAYRPAKRLLKIWIAKRAKSKEIIRKYAAATHCSSRKAAKEMRYLEIICKKNPSIREELNLNIDDMNFIQEAI